jgi:hypothetical protein
MIVILPSMSTAILQITAQIDAKAAYNDIKTYLYIPDTSRVDTIFGGYGKLQKLIVNIDYTEASDLIGSMDQMYTWIPAIKQAVTDLQEWVYPHPLTRCLLLTFTHAGISLRRSPNNQVALQNYSQLL